MSTDPACFDVLDAVIFTALFADYLRRRSGEIAAGIDCLASDDATCMAMPNSWWTGQQEMATANSLIGPIQGWHDLQHRYYPILPRGLLPRYP